ncbi:class II cAMP phosphodiesterase [Coprinopsis cinerea okayama7|uniref:Class II cAMP phosphodiesterase n=1 Tax=Coprinopsis cinerea (strain Okayama-7 / 130 / ATCC MYA-4618 / FGSC 9003) TaxID=240176 RepID=A8NG51_COPC7|nr:class II cAMP phosphodiesterase [Coprinopsis cinerea okayama7\|eukprot:XP_001833477.1 class II cAMP phosphodiesterase [Coprinopsis cinerea okayama7\
MTGTTTTSGINPSPGTNTAIIADRVADLGLNDVSDDECPSPMTAFDIVVVGAGGGPDESNLSAYLLKSHTARWEDGVLALEAGSGQGTLARILKEKPDLFRDPDGESDQVKNQALTASDIYNSIQGFLITHAHMDHIMSLVISAGSLSGCRKRIYAVKQTLKDIESSVFNDRAWPNLASWREDDASYKFLYSPLTPNTTTYEPVSSEFSVATFPLNHGSNDLGPYESVAYFVRQDASGQEFLFFGDVEPDSVASLNGGKPQTLAVWQFAAPKIPHMLSTIFIECSYPSGRADSLLFGHLTPEYLVEELVALAAEVRKSKPAGHSSDRPNKHVRKRQKRLASSTGITNALAGLTVYVTHCKDAGLGDESSGRPMREVIVEQVRSLAEAKGLGVTIKAAEQGMHIQI